MPLMALGNVFTCMGMRVAEPPLNEHIYISKQVDASRCLPVNVRRHQSAYHAFLVYALVRGFYLTLV